MAQWLAVSLEKKNVIYMHCDGFHFGKKYIQVHNSDLRASILNIESFRLFGGELQQILVIYYIETLKMNKLWAMEFKFWHWLYFVVNDWLSHDYFFYQCRIIRKMMLHCISVSFVKIIEVLHKHRHAFSIEYSEMRELSLRHHILF